MRCDLCDVSTEVVLADSVRHVTGSEVSVINSLD